MSVMIIRYDTDINTPSILIMYFMIDLYSINKSFALKRCC